MSKCRRVRLIRREMASVMAVVAALGSSLAWAAAGNEGHGGNVVFCRGKAPVVLDYYDATLPLIASPAPPLVDISAFSQDQVVDLFRRRFSEFSFFKTQFEEALQIVGPIGSWIDVNLKDMGDANETYFLSSSCAKSQAAARQGATMYGDSSVINQLSPAQQGILVVHEALYYVADTTLGLKTSENIRAVIREALKVDYSPDLLAQAIQRIGGVVTPWQRFLGRKFRGTESGDRSGELEVVRASIHQVTLRLILNGTIGPDLNLSCASERGVCFGVQTYDESSNRAWATYRISADGRTVSVRVKFGCEDEGCSAGGSAGTSTYGLADHIRSKL